MIELMIVVATTSMLALVAAPRFTTLMHRSALSWSRPQLEAMIVPAREGAIQKGRPATLGQAFAQCPPAPPPPPSPARAGAERRRVAACG